MIGRSGGELLPIAFSEYPMERRGGRTPNEQNAAIEFADVGQCHKASHYSRRRCADC
jgi:hypothetical protein